MPAPNEPVRIDVGIGSKTADSVAAGHSETAISYMPDIEVETVRQSGGELIATPWFEIMVTMSGTAIENKLFNIAPAVCPAMLLPETTDHMTDSFQTVATPTYGAYPSP